MSRNKRSIKDEGGMHLVDAFVKDDITYIKDIHGIHMVLSTVRVPYKDVSERLDKEFQEIKKVQDLKYIRDEIKKLKSAVTDSFDTWDEVVGEIKKIFPDVTFPPKIKRKK